MSGNDSVEITVREGLGPVIPVDFKQSAASLFQHVETSAFVVDPMATRAQRHGGVRVDVPGMQVMLVETETVRLTAYDACPIRSILRTLFKERN